MNLFFFLSVFEHNIAYILFSNILEVKVTQVLLILIQILTEPDGSTVNITLINVNSVFNCLF